MVNAALMTRFTILLLASSLLVACSKSDSGKGGSAAKTAEGAAVKLGKVPLQATIVGDDINVGDGIGAHSVMVSGGDIGAMEVELADKKLEMNDEAKEVTSLYSAKNVKTEKLADGWVLTFDNTGSAGANYFVESYRDIGGKTYKCASTLGKPEQALAVVAACKSLRP